MVKQALNVELADLVATFDLPAMRFQRELALLGWGTIVQEATRLTHAEEFKRNVRQRNIDPASFDVTPTWAHLVQAAKEFLSHLASQVPGTPTRPPDRLAGYVCVLFDGMTGLSKIGRDVFELLNNNKRKPMISALAHCYLPSSLLSSPFQGALYRASKTAA